MANRGLSANMLWLCVNYIDDHSFKGEVYSTMIHEPIQFHDFDQLILRCDELFDEIEFPQAFQEKRSFKKHNAKVELSKARRSPIKNDQEIMNHHGLCFTGIIMVSTRQFTNWQGMVMNEDFQPLYEFHDIVELMSFITNNI